MADWYREDERRARGYRDERDHSRPGRGMFDRARDEVRSWLRDDEDDDHEHEHDHERPWRPVDDGRVAVSGVRPAWLDRRDRPGSNDRSRHEEMRLRHEEARPRHDAARPRHDGIAVTQSAFWMVPGPHVGHGPNGYRRSDERILEEVCERLMQHGRIDARHVDVIVSNGEVTLRGNIDDREMKRAAEDVAESVFGVVDVRNELKTVPPLAAQGADEPREKIDPKNR